MESQADDPTFGIASNDAAGRQKAIEWFHKVRDAVDRLVQNQTGNVLAVQIHSAPRANRSSPEALLQSMEEILSWDWKGSEVVIEHCDALVPSHDPIKGFLALEDELRVIESLQSKKDVKTPFGMSINWGRSAIEGRSDQTPFEHISKIKNFESRLSRPILRGLMFSGVTSSDPIYGNWIDGHPPFASPNLNSRNSMLTPELAKQCIDGAGSLLYLGLKIAPKPIDMPLDEKLPFMEEGIAIVNQHAK
eukprot:TRINITY_DN1038_c0_g4_i1.p1 TRINITY_DN1038_c0_g4~~TRINITY_DN1038_c0_g4_i1.p1  ORF type:complete len:248 (+),score=88.95 TRINITY_DN1038_c0_g4_i1:145-888(+)